MIVSSLTANFCSTRLWFLLLGEEYQRLEPSIVESHKVLPAILGCLVFPLGIRAENIANTNGILQFKCFKAHLKCFPVFYFFFLWNCVPRKRGISYCLPPIEAFSRVVSMLHFVLMTSLPSLVVLIPKSD